MIRVIMHGCNGHMGRVITDIINNKEEMEIVAGIDPYDDGHNTYPVYPTIEKCDVEADVVIDFAAASAEDALLDYCVAKQLPLVLCTTGLQEEQLAHIRKACQQVAILKSANMSLGINMLLKLLREAGQILGDAGFDVEVVEKHHNQKLDAPSGTALALADAVKEELGPDYFYRYDRSSLRQKRDPKEIGISSVRGGNIVGEHDVIFAGEDEVITFRHTAYSKAVFAKGAVEAAAFLAGKKPGLYDMADVIAAK